MLESGLLDASYSFLLLAAARPCPLTASPEGLVEEVREKQVISNLATVEVYGFSGAAITLEVFQVMLSVECTTLGEYYVAPSYNYMIKRGHPVAGVNLRPIGKIMHAIEIPVDVE